MEFGRFRVDSLYYMAFNAVAKKKKQNFYWECISQLPSTIKQEFLHYFACCRLLKNDTIHYLVDGNTTKLVTDGSSLNPSSYSKLLICKNMKYLDLSSPCVARTNVNASIDELFQSYHCLEYVSLHNLCCISNDSIIHLAQNCPRLSFIDLGGCINIGDEAVMAIADHCHVLCALQLSKTQVSGRSISHLAKSKCAETLKEIGLVGCKNVPTEYLNTFAAHFRELEVLNCPALFDISGHLLDVFMDKGKMLNYTLLL